MFWPYFVIFLLFYIPLNTVLLTYGLYAFISSRPLHLISFSVIQSFSQCCGDILGATLRRISCHGKNHSHTRCEYSETIFLCYHHYSEYSLLGSKFSTNLLFEASKCQVTIQRQWQFKIFKMAEGSDGCSGETLLAPCTRKKRLQRKMTKDNYWIGVQENIGMFSRS